MFVMATLRAATLDAKTRRSRAVALGFVAATVGLLVVFDPGALAMNRMTCPFLSLIGLPCAFCGLTRALHHLLRGDWSYAWYLNPLSIPIALVSLGLFARTAIEVVTGRRSHPLPCPRRAWLVALVALFFVHWAMHIRGAVTTPKPELLAERLEHGR